MGNYQPLVALLVPDKKLDRFGQRQIFSTLYQNNLAYHPGPVLPHGGDGSPLVKLPKCPYSKNVPHGQKYLWQDIKGTKRHCAKETDCTGAWGGEEKVENETKIFKSTKNAFRYQFA